MAPGTCYVNTDLAEPPLKIVKISNYISRPDTHALKAPSNRANKV